MNYAVYRKKPETFSFLGILLENSHISDLVEQYTVEQAKGGREHREQKNPSIYSIIFL